MKRIGAALGGLAFVVLIFGGLMAVRIVSRFLFAAVRFVETVGVFALALLIGYIVYRILLGTSDDPRRSR